MSDFQGKAVIKAVAIMGLDDAVAGERAETSRQPAHAHLLEGKVGMFMVGTAVLLALPLSGPAS